MTWIFLGQTEDEQKQAWERAKEAYQKLVPGFGRKPDDFEEVAKMYDESDRNPDTGGLVEWVRMGEDVKFLERVEPKPLAFEQVEHHIRAELEARQHEQLDSEVAFRLLKEARAILLIPKLAKWRF